jgi:hypothetical protein
MKTIGDNTSNVIILNANESVQINNNKPLTQSENSTIQTIISNAFLNKEETTTEGFEGKKNY